MEWILVATFSKSCHNWWKAINDSVGPDLDRVSGAVRVGWDDVPSGAVSQGVISITVLKSYFAQKCLLSWKYSFIQRSKTWL